MNRRGQRIGGYEVLGELGRGGMGVVYRARDVASDREVALKMTRGTASPEQLERLEREGQITASLQHPGIVAIHASGRHDDHLYLAYELVEACETVDKVFERVDLRERVVLVRDAARALGHAHAHGVVHRDVKPENLLVGEDGRVRVADFGLAAAADLERITRTGALLGTPYYMSPEQISGNLSNVGPRADVWSLGVVLYQALTRELPFVAPSFVELSARIYRSQVEPPRSHDPRVPPALEAICLKTLRKDLTARYADGTELADDLDAFLKGRSVTAQETRRRPAWIVAALCATLTVGALAVDDAAPELVVPTALPVPVVQPVEPPPRVEPPPGWYLGKRPSQRPTLPLPLGLAFGERHGEYVNGRDRSVLRWIPPGSFEQRRVRRKATSLDTTRQVRISRGFFLGKFEVTVKQFERFCRKTGHAAPARLYGATAIGENYAVSHVNWNDAQAYLLWAGLRLPTEAEWEYVARGGDEDRAYAWGAELQEENRCNIVGFADGYPYTAPVGSFPQGVSRWGCHDMIGNVSEWVQDGHAQFTTVDAVDPLVKAKGHPKSPLRGGDSFDAPRPSTLYRWSLPRNERHESAGFRVCRNGS